MLCLYVYNVLPPQRLPGSFEDRLCNGQRKIKETRFKKKKKKKKKYFIRINIQNLQIYQYMVIQLHKWVSGGSRMTSVNLYCFVSWLVFQFSIF